MYVEQRFFFSFRFHDLVDLVLNVSLSHNESQDEKKKHNVVFVQMCW